MKEDREGRRRSGGRRQPVRVDRLKAKLLRSANAGICTRTCTWSSQKTFVPAQYQKGNACSTMKNRLWNETFEALCRHNYFMKRDEIESKRSEQEESLKYRASSIET